MPRIEVEPVGSDDVTYKVEVTEGGSASRHKVTMTDEDYRRLSGTEVPPDEFVEACFEFLLDREPKESILAEFDVTLIGQYFPGFEDEIGGYL